MSYLLHGYLLFPYNICNSFSHHLRHLKASWTLPQIVYQVHKVTARMSLSERVQDTLALLRSCRLSPFDLVLEILDEDKPEYSSYRTEFYKEGNEKLSKILDAVLSSGPGRSKLRTWMRQPVTVDLFCDVITQEMNNVQKAELLPGIAAITPRIHQELDYFSPSRACTVSFKCSFHRGADNHCKREKQDKGT